MPVAATSFEYLRKLLLERSAILLEPGKEYLVELRLLPVARCAGLETVDALVERLRAPGSADLALRVVEAMTTNETSFFRDIHPFEVLRRSVLPELIAARRAERRLSIWCGASSSGQEPYSVAMVLREHFPELASWNLRLVASDLSNEVLERARAGVYSQFEVGRGMPAAMLVKHFEQVGASWRIRPELRAMVHFQRINLIEDYPLTGIDIVFLRNVLIYFDVPTKTRILRRVRQVLRPDGWLFLGSAETTLHLDADFERVAFDRVSCYRPAAVPPPERVSLPR